MKIFVNRDGFGRAIERSILLAWITAWLCPILFIIWLLLDELMVPFLGAQSLHLYFHEPEFLGIVNDLSQSEVAWRTPSFSIGLGISLLSLLTILSSLAVGPIAFRRLRHWIGLIAILSLWLIIIPRSMSIGSAGEQFRIARHARAIETYLQFLEDHWIEIVQPEITDTNGNLEWAIPTCNAYPQWKPTMCFFLESVQIPNTSFTLCAAERTPGKAIRIELSNQNRGKWLELRFDENPPTDFRGGLDELYTVVWYRKLKPHLYLVRFKSS